jgi:hypothetical protein
MSGRPSPGGVRYEREQTPPPQADRNFHHLMAQKEDEVQFDLELSGSAAVSGPSAKAFVCARDPMALPVSLLSTRNLAPSICAQCSGICTCTIVRCRLRAGKLQADVLMF